MQTKRQHEIHAYVGAPSLTATLLALVISAFGATAASAHVTSTHAQRDKASALAAHARVLRPGMGYASAGSPTVRDLQRLLATAGFPAGRIDGRYGPHTTLAVMRYQANWGLQLDGVAGPSTLAALAGRGVVLGPGAGYASGGSPAVRDLQRRLARAGYAPGPFDGRYGPLTERAVRRYQAHARLPVNGLAGSRTFAELRLRPQAKHTASGRPRSAPATAASGASALAPTTPAPAATAPTATAPGAPAPVATAPTATAPATPVPAAAPAKARRADHSVSTGWIWLLALLSVGVAVGVRRYVRRGPGDSWQKAASLGREARNLTVDLGRGAARSAARFRPMAASAGRQAAGLAAALRQKTPGWTAGLRQRMATVAALLRRRTASLAADLSRHATSLAAGSASLAAGLGRQATSLGQKTAGWPRQAPVGRRRMLEYRAAVRPNGAQTPGTKGVVASGAREDRHHSKNGDPGGIRPPPTDINAAFNLGVLLEERKDLAAAEAAYRRADERGHAAAASNLGVLLEAQGDPAGAEAAYRRADRRGDASGSFNLGVLLEAREDLAGAEAAYRRADKRGHAAAASNLGVLLEARGDPAGAEAAYRRADQGGEANGSFNLGVLLEETDDLRGAVAAYRRAERSADMKVAQLARAARLELTSGIGVSGAAHNEGDVDGA